MGQINVKTVARFWFYQIDENKFLKLPLFFYSSSIDYNKGLAIYSIIDSIWLSSLMYNSNGVLNFVIYTFIIFGYDEYWLEPFLKKEF